MGEYLFWSLWGDEFDIMTVSCRDAGERGHALDHRPDDEDEERGASAESCARLGSTQYFSRWDDLH